ncbi:DUF4262 domain-containing protein [Actinoplanes sp. ATCC 53533]|uniref:DUF4262 domain-containing protein n=1 Tax=Actinoplanes sp. ATCC 53533 TaxID=1288362 RepID=UPI000F78E7EF|nr:DUF4262 domain-containing protein [Actinoplanes sp. ATCC 53533]RSM61757.1 DUF4262 domain-containing protein [Actinoplanes sp. ATCC 53533]
MPSVGRFLRRMQQRIDQQGWAILTIPANDNQHTALTYTIGLTALQCPELLIAGTDPAVSQHLLNELARRVVQRAERLSAGQRINDLLDGSDAILVEGPATGALRPAAAYVRYGQDCVGLLQVVWPDTQGRFPWEPCCTLSPQAQPLIGRP